MQVVCPSHFSNSNENHHCRPRGSLKIPVLHYLFQVSDRNHTTNLGATHHDEMCNFYFMYSYDPLNNPGYIGCTTDQKWENIFDNIPSEATTWNGFNYEENF